MTDKKAKYPKKMSYRNKIIMNAKRKTSKKHNNYAFLALHTIRMDT